MKRKAGMALAWAGTALAAFSFGRLLTLPAGGERAATAVLMRVVATHNRSHPLYTLSIEYPAFDRCPALSSEIAEYVNHALSEFESAARANWAARVATTPLGTPRPVPDHSYTFQATWEPAQINDRLVSLIVRLYWFSGGAHGEDQLRTFNYDVMAHKEVTLAELFGHDPHYLEALSRAARASLIASLTDRSGGHAPDEMIERGTEPTAENFRNFTFTDETVTLHFQKYQVAPGYFGPQSVVVPRPK